jgi:uncharacterized membrane protein
MNVKVFLGLYALSVPIFFLIDMVWLGLIAKGFYQEKIGHLLGEVQWVPAVIFYLLFLVGLTFFATYPGVQAGSLKTSILYGAMFGFFTYMTYDLTNLATLKGWPLSIVFVDVLWGAILGGVVAGLVAYIYLAMK